MWRKTRFIIAVLLAGLVFAACTDDGNKQESVRDRESAAINTGFDRLTQSQQVPSFDYSQERQTLIDVLTLRAEGTHGTAYVRALDGTLLWWCPTVGAPVPSTYQLTNPDQLATTGPRERGTVTLPLGEPSGVYTGDSAATWVLCLDDNGNAFARYDEATVGWVSGIVDDLPPELRARVDEITFQFTEQSEG